MTDQEQQRTDHLALVAAPIYAAFWAHIHGDAGADHEQARQVAVEIAERLQKAAEEMVAKP